MRFFVSILLLALSPLPASADGILRNPAKGVVISSAGPKLGQIPIQPDYLCGVGVVTGADAWECLAASGSNPTVTQGTGTTYASTPFGGRRAATPGSDAGAPSAPGFGNTLDPVWNSGSWTVVAAFNRTAKEQMPFAHGTSAGGVLMSTGAAGDGLTCRVSGDSSVIGSASTQTIAALGTLTQGWAVGSCRMGSGTITARLNGSASSVASTVQQPIQATASATTPWFGRYSSAGRYMEAPLGYVAIYRRALTDAELSLIEAGWFGGLVGDRPITTTRASPADCQADDGTWYRVGDNAPCVNSKGIFSGRAVTNYWTNSTTPGSWTAVSGTPTASGNTVTDDTAAAWEGWQSPSANPGALTSGTWTASCYVRAGTLSALRLRVDGTGGTGSTACDFANLTSEWRRVTCTATLAGLTGGVVGKVYIGSGAADVGTLEIAQCQVEVASTPGPRFDCTTAPCTRAADQPTISGVGVPASEVEASFRFCPQAVSGVTSGMMLDARNPTGNTFFVGSSGSMNYYNGSTYGSSVLTWRSDSCYTLDYVLAGGVIRFYRDGALISSVSGVTPPTFTPVDLYVGTENGTVNWANGTVQVLYIGPPRPRSENSGQSYFEADLWHSGEPWPCTSLDSCVLDCWANASGSMDCTDGDGLPVAVTPGTGATVESTPFRPADGRTVRGMLIDAVSEAPTIDAATINAILSPILADRHLTVISVAQPERTSTTPGSGVLIGNESAPSRNGFILYSDDGVSHCRVNNNTSSTRASVTSPVSGTWGVFSCRQDGDSITSRVNGTSATVTSTITGDVTTSPLRFGEWYNQTEQLKGPLAHVRIYSRALSDAELAEYEARMWGTWAEKPGTPITVSRSTKIPCQPDKGGEWYTLGPNAGCVNAAKGLEVRGAATNLATNPTSGTWSANNGATYTGTGPWVLTDNVPTQGFITRAYSGFTAGAAAFTFTAGISTSDFPIRIRITSPDGGAGDAVCDFASASHDGRYSCTVNYGAAYAGNTHVYVFGGTTAAQTGTWTVNQIQIERSATPGRRCDAASCAADVATVSTTGWPVDRGEVRLNYTPAVSIPDAPAMSWRMLLDSGRITNTGGIALYLRRDLGQLYEQIHGGGTNQSAASANLSWAPGTPYGLTMRWTPSTVAALRDASSVISTTHAVTAGNPAATGCIGGDCSTAGREAEGWLRNLRLGAY